MWPASSSSTPTLQASTDFRLKASNGQIIAVGEAYESKDSALNGIASVRNNAPGAALDDQTT